MNIKKLFSVLLTLVMMLSIIPTQTFAVCEKVTLTVEASKTTAVAADEITFTVYAEAEEGATSGWQATLAIPEGLTYVSGDLESGLETTLNAGSLYEISYEDLTNVMIVMSFENALALSEKTKVMTFKCTVDNDVAGTYTVGLEDFVAYDADNNDMAAGEYGVVGATVTIGAPHTHDWSEDYTSNSTHHWKNCEANGCDITEDSAKNSYAEHSYDQEEVKDDYKITDGDCVTGAKYFKSCICGAKPATEGEDNVFYTQTLDHKYEPVEAQTEVHTFTELKGAVAAHYKCSVANCGKLFILKDGKYELTTIADLTSSAPIHNEDDWGHDKEQHWRICSVCQFVAENVVKSNHTFDDIMDTTCNDDCGYTREQHEHTYSEEWSYDGENHWHAATCGCGENEVSGKEAHYGGVATCVSKAKCDICGAEYGDVDTNNHNFATGDDWSKDETRHWHACKNTGCTVKNDSSQHIGMDDDKVCDTCGYDANCKHIGTTLVHHEAVPAECEKNGSKEYWECDGCGTKFAENNIESDIITDPTTSVKGHTYSPVDAVSEKHTPDVLEPGVAAHFRCPYCGKLFVNEDGKYIEKTLQDLTGEKPEHKFTDDSIKDEALKTKGDCGKEAVYFRSCTVCGAVDNDENNTFIGERDAENHANYGTYLDGDKPADHKNQIKGYTGDKKCKKCDALIEKGQDILPGDHNYTSGKKDDKEHWVVCSVEGCDLEQEGSRKSHSSKTAVCGQTARCDVCGRSYPDKREHEWDTSQWGYQAEDGHANFCKNCIAHNEVIAHTPNIEEATEEQDKVCTVCGYTIATKKHVHTTKVLSGYAATCTTTGLTEGSECSICGQTLVAQSIISKLAHESGLTVVENIVFATPYYPGSYDFVTRCKNCSTELSRKTVFVSYSAVQPEPVVPVVPETPEETPEEVHMHNYEDIDGFDPTCTETGLTDGVICSDCGESLIDQDVLPATGHTYTPFVVENMIEATATVDGSYDLVSECSVCGEELARINVVLPATGEVENPDTVDDGASVNGFVLSAIIMAFVAVVAVVAKKYFKVK